MLDKGLLREFEQHAINRSRFNENFRIRTSKDDLMSSLNSIIFNPSEVENPVDVLSVSALKKIK